MPGRAAPAIGVVFGLAGLGIAAFRPLSFDEAYWLVMAERMIHAGDLPYFDLLDNKGPLLYLLTALSLLLPAQPEQAVAVLFAVASGLLATGAWRLAMTRGQPRFWCLVSSVTTTVSTMALSTWSVTTELLAVTALAWALSRDRPWSRVVLTMVACLIDPRALLFAPLALADGWRARTLGRRHLLAFVGAATAALAFVLMVPALRYAFIEASLATRFDAVPSDLVLVGTAGVAPLLVLFLARVRLRPILAISTGAIGIIVGASSGLPFGHYWAYVALAVPLIPIETSRFSPASTIAVVVAIICLTALATRQHLAADIDRSRRDTPVATTLSEAVREDDRVVIWGSSPLLRVPVASHTLGFSPTSNYFAWGLPEPERLLDGLRRDLDDATLLVIAPDLAGYRHVPTVNAALDLIEQRIKQATCSAEIPPLVIYRFGASC